MQREPIYHTLPISLESLWDTGVEDKKLGKHKNGKIKFK